jgi:hypothetical protein
VARLGDGLKAAVTVRGEPQREVSGGGKTQSRSGSRLGAANRLLEPLSGWAGVDSNHRLTDYESAALTN